MNKPISRRAHGYTDYTYIPFTAYAPELMNFTNNKTATLLCKLLAAGILTSSVFTRAEWGLLKQMSFKNHLLIDTLGGITSLSAPFLFGFAKQKRARNTFLVIGTFGLLAGLLSQPEEIPEGDEAAEPLF